VSGGFVLRAPSRLGDFVMAEPVARALDLQGGGTWIAPAAFFALVEGRFPNLRRVALASRGDERVQLYRGHARALLLNGSWRSAWCAFAAGVAERVGLSSHMRGALLTAPITPARPAPRPFTQVCVEVALHAGLEVRDRRPRLESAPAAQPAPFVLVNAGSRPGSAKGFVPAHLSAILERIELPAKLVCARGEEYPGAEVVGLPELASLAARAAVVLTTDGGARHVCSAAGAPTLVLYGPTDRRHTSEHGPRERGLSIAVDCGPCHRETCRWTGADERACLTGIDPARVAALLRDLAARAG
jgi:ADP-heptose:LPS heptosyltransferase